MAKSPINVRLEKAVALHQAGRLEEADRLYDQIIALDRSNPDALNLKGVIANTRGQFAAALPLFDRAIAVLPKYPEMRLNRGLALAGLGRNEEAIEAYKDAIRLRPNYGDARLNFALLLHSVGRAADAIAAFRAMTVAAPLDPRGFYNLGVCLDKSLPDTPEEERGVIADEAKAALSRAEELDPKNPDIQFAFANLHSFLKEYSSAIDRLKGTLDLHPKWTDEFRAQALSDLGEYLHKEKRLTEALEYHRLALTLSPKNAIIRFNLATTLADYEMRAEAMEIYESLIQTDPGFPKPFVNLAKFYYEDDRLEDSLRLLERALALGPSHQAYSNMGGIFADKGWLVTSLIFHDKAVSLRKDDPKTQFNRSIAFLTIGHFSRGWPDYDYRFLVPEEGAAPRPEPPPLWRGEDLTGKTLFINTEQGIGDEALHASMLPEFIGRAARCIIETSERMAPVFARSFPGTEIVHRVTEEKAIEDQSKADFQISAPSLGQYLRRDFASFPKHGGYLKADPEVRARLRHKYEVLAQGRRIVGLAWKSKRLVYGKSKSATPLMLSAILKVPGVMFVNLQYGSVEDDIAEVRAALGIDIYRDPEVNPLKDMDIFYAQVAAMDRVISTSNTAAHVAGSIGMPTWLLLPHGRGCLWYWFLNREDSPWYPSFRILRGSGENLGQDWEAETSARAAAELARWVNNGTNT